MSSAEVWIQVRPDKIDTLGVFLKEFLKKVDFEKISADDKKHAKLPSHEIVVCFRDTTFTHGVVGKAIKGTICTFQYSGGINEVSISIGPAYPTF